MNLTLKVWRQANADAKGKMETYQMSEVSPDMSFLEMMDVLNEELIEKGIDPVAFDHDCREGICGMCSMFINCLLYTSPSPRDATLSRMPSSA